jgi:lipoprotein Spr
MHVRLIVFFLLFPCLASAQPDSTRSFTHDYTRKYLEQSLGFTLPENARLDLYDTVVTWLGTPYRYAGNSEHGIDCSGFVNMLCNRVYGINPGARSSTDIYERVDHIDREDLQEGDLIFFRIHRRRISHVGIYLGNSLFVHASTSRGVIISNLNEPYYKRYFAGAGRIPRPTGLLNGN